MSSQKGAAVRGDNDAIFRLPPYYYMHVLDLNSVSCVFLTKFFYEICFRC